MIFGLHFFDSKIDSGTPKINWSCRKLISIQKWTLESELSSRSARVLLKIVNFSKKKKRRGRETAYASCALTRTRTHAHAHAHTHAHTHTAYSVVDLVEAGSSGSKPRGKAQASVRPPLSLCTTLHPFAQSQSLTIPLASYILYPMVSAAPARQSAQPMGLLRMGR